MLSIKEIKNITENIKKTDEYKLGKKIMEGTNMDAYIKGITPKISTDDDFINFIKYRVREKFDDAEDIIRIIEKPYSHDCQGKYIQYLKEEVYGDTEDAPKDVPNSHTI